MSAVERFSGATELVFSTADSEPFTTSLVMARETGNDHASVMRLIRDNLADFETFGIVGFEIRKSDGPGRPENFAILNEGQATLLITFMRNNEIVRSLKVRLVHAFIAMRQMLAQRAAQPALTEDEIVHQALAITARRVEELTAEVAELKPKAEVADKLLDAEGDLSVGDTAQALTRAGIKTGQGRLFSALELRKWIYRSKGDGRWRVMQAAIDGGWMSVIPQSHYHPKTGVLVLDPPQPRVTPKGLQRLLTDWGVPA